MSPVTLQASQAKPVKHTLQLDNPKLWWPAGYGQPNLYDVSLQFETAPNAVSDARKFQAGVRQFTYSEEGRALRMWINGRRFIAKGGSWGFGESMLRYRAREYDAAVRYHARDELQHDPQLGRADRRRRVLRSLRPPRCRGMAGFLAGQSMGRSRSRRQWHVPAQREGLRAADPQSPIDRALCRAQRGLSAQDDRRRHTGHAGRFPSWDTLHFQFGGRCGQRARPLPGAVAEVLLLAARHPAVSQRDGNAQHRHARQPAADDAGSCAVAARALCGGSTNSPTRARKTAGLSARASKRATVPLPMWPTGCGSRSSKTTRGTGPCSRRRARTGWGC